MKSIEVPVFHALLKKENVDGCEVWIAQGLEFDLVAQATSKSELHRKFSQTVVAHVMSSVQKGEDPLASLKRLGEAPQEYWKAYVRSKKIEKPVAFPPKNKRFDTSEIHPSRLIVKQAQAA